MKKIKLYGDLQKFKTDWELDVKTPSEALRAIDVNRPGFLHAADAGDYVAILVDADNPDLTRQVTLDNCIAPWGDELLVVLPRVGGDIPVPFILASALATMSGMSVAMAGAVLAAIGNLMISLAVSAISNVITGDKGQKNAGDTEKPQNKPSFISDGPVNLSRAGHPYPLIFGENLCGSMVLSSRVLIKNVKL